MSEEPSYKFDTLQIHAGAKPDPATGARQTPIYQSTAFVFRDADHAAKLFNLEEVGYIYSDSQTRRSRCFRSGLQHSREALVRWRVHPATLPRSWRFFH